MLYEPKLGVKGHAIVGKKLLQGQGKGKVSLF